MLAEYPRTELLKRFARAGSGDRNPFPVGEEWRPVPGFANCEASSRGRIHNNSEEAWLRAAKEALNGDLRALRNRVEIREAPQIDVVLSREQSS
jgi:hypothetical protein